MKRFRKLISWLKERFNSTKHTWLFYGLVLLVGGLITWFTYEFAIIFSDIGLIMIFLAICLGFYHLFDAVILKDLDFVDEIQGDGRIKQGNIAYAIVLLAVAVIILAGAITVG